MPDNRGVHPDTRIVIFINNGMTEHFNLAGQKMIIEVAVGNMDNFPGVRFEIFIVSEAIIIDGLFGMGDFVEIIVISGDTSVDAEFFVHSSIISFLGFLD